MPFWALSIILVLGSFVLSTLSVYVYRHFIRVRPFVRKLLGSIEEDPVGWELFLVGESKNVYKYCDTIRVTVAKRPSLFYSSIDDDTVYWCEHCRLRDRLAELMRERSWKKAVEKRQEEILKDF